MVCPPPPPSAFRIETVFEQLRHSLDELLQRATKPEDRREVIARMKDTLVQATLGVEDLRNALGQSRRKLEHEQRELATVRRRKELATGIQDAETMAVAERFERQHAERAAVLEEKIAAQTHELDLAERELVAMKAELRGAMTAGPAGPSGAPLGGRAEEEDALGEPSDAAMRQEIDALARERARADRDAEAERRLEELKKNMGK